MLQSRDFLNTHLKIISILNWSHHLHEKTLAGYLKKSEKNVCSIFDENIPENLRVKKMFVQSLMRIFPRI